MSKIKYYPDIVSNVSFPEIEKEVLEYWKKNNIFQESISNRNSELDGENNEFIFYDGPPFANGLPHYGHLLTGFIKDMYARYQTTQGKKVERRFGWDCHGLPAEMGAEKDLGFSGRTAITDYGIDKFNAYCKKSVMKYSQDWEQYVNRQARWVDFENSYKTMDATFMESVLWAFKELYKKGLIYKSMRVMPYSWACETPLSNFETRLDNSYRQKKDKAVTVAFELHNKPEFVKEECASYKILAWTTTPWTLPSNLALGVKPDMDYTYIIKNDICYIFASFASESYAKELSIIDSSILQVFKGKALEGLGYKPLFDYFQDHKNSFKILSADFIEEGSGTGIVHLAPGFGEEDQSVCQQNGIELVCPVDNSGRFTTEIVDFSGLQVFEANEPIIIKLKQQNQWIKTEQYLHNYPHCWRTDTPLIYKAVPSWYVKVTEFKDRMVELNQQINWIPGNVKDGLFGKWLENARDWSISRNRFWGTPIPVWQSDDPQYPRIDVYGSIAELEADFKCTITDLHKPFIDDLVRPNPDDPTGKSMMRRVPDVFDCWFESGSMPYGQVHYPFENKEWFEKHFPADFIVEYSAQTRGWFYTLMVLSTALFDRPPFLNCICHGVILDASGQKLSKRLNNYADPMDLFAKYGSDALRVTMLSSNVVKGQELLIDKDGKMVFDMLRLFIKPIWNAYHFFCLYANSDSIQAKESYQSTNVFDIYILSKLKISVEEIEKSMDLFDSQSAYQVISDFFEVLNNWYIRRNRNRFWKHESDNDKIDAYNTLHTSLLVMTKAMSSMLPLISECIYRGLTQNSSTTDHQHSVHLTDFPVLHEIKIDSELILVMDKVLDICSNALFIRNDQGIRVRQPLHQLKIISNSVEDIKMFEDVIKDEINVKSIVYSNDLSKLADTKLVINFPVLGKRLPKKMKDITILSKQNKWGYDSEDNVVIAEETLLNNEYSINLVPRCSESMRALSNNNGIVELDLNITKDLEIEGLARDIIRLIQQARKDAKYDISDYIKLQITSEEIDLSDIVSSYKDLICEQTLSQFDIIAVPDHISISKLHGKDIRIALEKS